MLFAEVLIRCNRWPSQTPAVRMTPVTAPPVVSLAVSPWAGSAIVPLVAIVAAAARLLEGPPRMFQLVPLWTNGALMSVSKNTAPASALAVGRPVVGPLVSSPFRTLVGMISPWGQIRKQQNRELWGWRSSAMPIPTSQGQNSFRTTRGPTQPDRWW